MCTQISTRLFTVEKILCLFHLNSVQEDGP
jgi:hypothetical protein